MNPTNTHVSLFEAPQVVMAISMILLFNHKEQITPLADCCMSSFDCFYDMTVQLVPGVHRKRVQLAHQSPTPL